MKRLKLWIWLLRNRSFWFQRRKPQEEIRTRIVEGRPGEGKTLYMTQNAIRYMRLGYRVAANYTIRDPLTGDCADKVDSWMDMLELSVSALEDGDPIIFFIDEIHLWAHARSYAQTPKWWLGLIAQRRHYGIAIWGSTQSLRFVEVALRAIVDECVRIRNRSFFRIPTFKVEVVDPSSIDLDGDDYQIMNYKWIWMRWHAYKGYDTRELMSIEKWETDEETDRRVEELTARAVALVVPGVIPAFSDAYARSVRPSDLQDGLPGGNLSDDSPESVDPSGVVVSGRDGSPTPLHDGGDALERVV